MKYRPTSLSSSYIRKINDLLAFAVKLNITKFVCKETYKIELCFKNVEWLNVVGLLGAGMFDHVFHKQEIVNHCWKSK